MDKRLKRKKVPPLDPWFIIDSKTKKTKSVFLKQEIYEAILEDMKILRLNIAFFKKKIAAKNKLKKQKELAKKAALKNKKSAKK